MRLIAYELKKMLKRPLTLVVVLGCAVGMAAAGFLARQAHFVFAYDPAHYATLGDAAQGDLYTLGGLPEGVVQLRGRAAVEHERQLARRFEGVWDDTRLASLVGEFGAFLDDPANYTGEIDSMTMQMRSWNLAAAGMSEAEIAAYDAQFPLYVMLPEAQYGERVQWNEVDDVLAAYAMWEDGSPKTMAEAFPAVGESGVYSYHGGPKQMLNFQSALVGLLVLMMVLAGAAPLFADEVVRGTEPVLLAARHGRGQLVWAKLIAGVLYALGCTLLLNLVTFLSFGLFYGFEGLGSPVQFSYGMGNSPFPLSMGGYLLAGMGVMAAGAVGLVALVMVLSALFSSPFPTLFTGAVASVAIILLAAYGSYPFNLLSALLPPAFIMPPMALVVGDWALPHWCLGLMVNGAVLAGAGGFLARRYRQKR